MPWLEVHRLLSEAPYSCEQTIFPHPRTDFEKGESATSPDKQSLPWPMCTKQNQKSCRKEKKVTFATILDQGPPPFRLPPPKKSATSTVARVGSLTPLRLNLINTNG